MQHHPDMASHTTEAAVQATKQLALPLKPQLKTLNLSFTCLNSLLNPAFAFTTE